MSEDAPQPRSSPAAGCIILSVTILVFGGLIVLYTVRGWWMNKEIDKFTTDTPAVLPVAEVDPARRAETEQKLIDLRTAIDDNLTERIILTADDLNTLIATQDLLSDFRGSAWIESIDADGMHTQVSQKLRGLRPGTFRYLVGTIDFVPLLRRTTVVFQIRDLKVPDKEVPRAFIESYSSQDFFKLDPNHPAMEDVLRGLERIYLEDGQVVIETRTRTGAEAAAEGEDDEQADG